MQQLISPGDRLVLEFDEEIRDVYDRLLAGVFKDELFLNEQLALDGYGAPSYYPPNDRFLAVIERAWAQAEADQVGMFAQGLPCEPDLP